MLLEISRVLGQYRDNMVLIGGWVPQFLFQDKNEWHSGSIDVDLALDHKRITDETYQGIEALLLERNYKEGKQPYSDRLDALVVEFRPHLENRLIQEGLSKLAKNFTSEEHIGPKFVSAFEEITDEDDRIQMERDFNIDNLRCRILSSFVVRVTRFAITCTLSVGSNEW